MRKSYRLVRSTSLNNNLLGKQKLDELQKNFTKIFLILKIFKLIYKKCLES